MSAHGEPYSQVSFYRNTLCSPGIPPLPAGWGTAPAHGAAQRLQQPGQAVHGPRVELASLRQRQELVPVLGDGARAG